MKKKIFISLILLMAIFILPSVVKAATSEVTIETIEVVSPTSGTYATGQVITVNVVYSANVVAQDSEYIPSLTLKFGTSQNYGSAYISTGTIKGNIIEYKYTIKERDSGVLTLDAYSGYGLEDEEGNRIETTTPTKLTGNEISANPIKWTDTSDLQISIDEAYELNVKGLTELSNHHYYVFVTNNSKVPTINLDEYNMISNATSNFRDKYPFQEHLEKNGEIYYWICEEQMNYDTGLMEQKFIVSAKKIERPAQNNLGSRMKAYFFSEETSTYLREPHDYEVERNIKLKIGKVTDKSVLLAIKNGEKNALNKLLTYSKSATALYTGTVPLGKSNTITDKFELIDDEYYYVYMVLDDENGKYYPVEDVSLYQACIGETIGKNLWDYLDGQFNWNIDEENYFSNFFNAKAVFERLNIDTENNTQEVILVIKDVISNTEKKHQFYYYVSNSKQDVPQYDSELWKKADKFTIDETTGKCYISTGNIMNLSYIDKLNLSEDIYISVYEVIADEEITSETISGEYELVLNAQKVILEESDDSTTAPDTELPQTGVNTVIIISLLIVLGMVGILTLMKYRNMKDIK